MTRTLAMLASVHPACARAAAPVARLAATIRPAALHPAAGRLTQPEGRVPDVTTDLSTSVHDPKRGARSPA
jgi:hypothetical protein